MGAKYSITKHVRVLFGCLFLCVGLAACGPGDIGVEESPAPGGGNGGEVQPWCGSSGEWSQAKQLDTGGGDNAAPRVFAYKSCEAVALWTLTNTDQPKLPVTQLAETWTLPDEIGNSTGSPGRIRIEGNDQEAIAVWQENLGPAGYGVFTAHYDIPTATWSSIVRLDRMPDGTVLGGTTPNVAINSTGQAIAVWAASFPGQSGVVGLDVVVRTYDGNSWSMPQLIEGQSGDALAGRPIPAAINDAGNAIVVWAQRNEPATDVSIFANTYMNGSWGAEGVIESIISQSSDDPALAMDASGQAWAVWRQYDGTRRNIWANRFDGSAWSTAELIESDDQGDAYLPQVRFMPNGRAIAAWSQFSGAREAIFVNVLDGNVWEGAQRIEWGLPGRAHQPHIAVDAVGRVLVVWMQDDGEIHNAWANWYDGTWGNPAPLADPSAGDVSNLRVDLDSYGSAIAVWAQRIGGADRTIWASHYLR